MCVVLKMDTPVNQTRSIVKYRNRLNSIPLRKFKPTEMDLFFAIAAQVRDRGEDKITLSFEQLTDLVGYKRSSTRLISDLESTYDKLLQLNAKTDDGDTITRFTLFNMYSISRKNETVSIAVNSRFKDLFNDLDRWTVFGLEQFAGLRSTYSKTMYRLVKQFRTTGIRRFKMDEFRFLLDIPDSYAAQHINKRVVSVINNELPSVIPGFKLQPIRRAQLKHPNQKPPKRGKGAAIVGYQATWKKENSRERKDITPKNVEQKVYERLTNDEPQIKDSSKLLDIQRQLYIRFLKRGSVRTEVEKQLLEAGVDVNGLKKKYLKGM